MRVCGLDEHTLNYLKLRTKNLMIQVYTTAIYFAILEQFFFVKKMAVRVVSWQEIPANLFNII